MSSAAYEKLRHKYKPATVRWLFVSESPPPDDTTGSSTRHFYRTEIKQNDRLFWNTMRALYKEAREVPESELAQHKSDWLQRFAGDGCYQIESLEQSLPHGTKTSERHHHLETHIPDIIEKITSLVGTDTNIILIKSTTYKILCEPLKAAGLSVINEDFIDYPGFWREQQFVAKLSALMKHSGWKHS